MGPAEVFESNLIVLLNKLLVRMLYMKFKQDNLLIHKSNLFAYTTAAPNPTPFLITKWFMSLLKHFCKRPYLFPSVSSCSTLHGKYVEPCPWYWNEQNFTISLFEWKRLCKEQDGKTMLNHRIRTLWGFTMKHNSAYFSWTNVCEHIFINNVCKLSNSPSTCLVIFIACIILQPY